MYKDILHIKLSYELWILIWCEWYVPNSRLMAPNYETMLSNLSPIRCYKNDGYFVILWRNFIFINVLLHRKMPWRHWSNRFIRLNAALGEGKKTAKGDRRLRRIYVVCQRDTKQVLFSEPDFFRSSVIALNTSVTYLKLLKAKLRNDRKFISIK